MKRLVMPLIACLTVLSFVDSGNAAGGAASRGGRVGVQQKNVGSARMPSIPIATIGVTTSVSNINETPAKVVPTEEAAPVEPEKPKDMREKEREACIRNNIGIGNTFVWASRYSDINNYSTMIEDTENPENNTCFVRVGVKSSDPRIDLSGIPEKYFEMGNNITCASWVDEAKLEQRILDAKKNARTWATVGGAVGGAALGVGSMELFGNKLINGKVEGQKSKKLNPKEKFRAYVLSLGDSERASLISYFSEMAGMCEELGQSGASLPDACSGVKLDDDEYYPYAELKEIKKSK